MMTEKKSNVTSLSVWAGVMIAAIAALPACLTAIYTSRAVEQKVDTVHELVNSRMTAALAKIDSLSMIVAEQRGQLKDEGVKAPEPGAVPDGR